MGSLMSLRSDLLRGDLRCHDLGWLLCVLNEEFAENGRIRNRRSINPN
jgi:hypothetical protein